MYQNLFSSQFDQLKERALRDNPAANMQIPQMPDFKREENPDLLAKVWLRDAHIEALKYELASERSKRIDREKQAPPIAAYEVQKSLQKAYESGIQIGTKRLHRNLRGAVRHLAAAVKAFEDGLTGVDCA